MKTKKKYTVHVQETSKLLLLILGSIVTLGCITGALVLLSRLF